MDRRVIVGLSRAPLGSKLGFCCRSRALVMLQKLRVPLYAVLKYLKCIF